MANCRPMTLDELKRLCEAATPGPWEWDYASPGWLLGGNAQPHADGQPGRLISCVLDGAVSDDGNDCNVLASDADRAFIAASRTYMPLLVAVAEAAGEVNRLLNEWDLVRQHSYAHENLHNALSALDSADEP